MPSPAARPQTNIFFPALGFPLFPLLFSPSLSQASSQVGDFEWGKGEGLREEDPSEPPSQRSWGTLGLTCHAEGCQRAGSDFGLCPVHLESLEFVSQELEKLVPTAQTHRRSMCSQFNNV